MTSRERIFNQVSGNAVDHIPMLGGWNLGVDTICALANVARHTYVKDPLRAVIQANKNLGVDGLIVGTVVPDPESKDEARNMSLTEHDYASFEPEQLVEDADKIPDNEASIRDAYHTTDIEGQLRAQYSHFISVLGDMVPIPTHWNAIANFQLWGRYGYEAFLAAAALYPEAVAKFFWESSIQAREFNLILVKMYKEFDLPPVLFLGNDFCTGQGPLVSPDFLRAHYWPQARYSIEPLLDAGIRLVHHCDGNVMPIIEDAIRVGFSGFQGFQYEFGVDPYILRDYVKDQHPLFFAGLSVTKTLPSGSADDVRDEVEYAMDFTQGGKGLFLFTSNVTGIDVPVENLRAAYAHQKTLVPGQMTTTQWREWPGFSASYVSK